MPVCLQGEENHFTLYLDSYGLFFIPFPEKCEEFKYPVPARTHAIYSTSDTPQSVQVQQLKFL